MQINWRALDESRPTAPISLGDITEPAVIQRALKRMRRAGQGVGVDGLPPKTFVKRWPYIRVNVLEAILGGDYDPLPSICHRIPKAKGGFREIYCLSSRDRFTQSLIVIAASPIAEGAFHERSHGFRKGRSPHTAIKQVQSLLANHFTHACTLDIEDFFGSITQSSILEAVEPWFNDHVLDLVERFLKTGGQSIVPPDEAELGTPQGGPISPLLANAVADHFDRFCESSAIEHVRFADDLIVFAKSREELEDKRELSKEFLRTELKLRTKESPESLLTSPHDIDFLGFTFGKDLLPRVAPGRVAFIDQRMTQKVTSSRIETTEAAKELITPTVQGVLNYYRSVVIEEAILKYLDARLGTLLMQRYPIHNPEILHLDTDHCVKRALAAYGVKGFQETANSMDIEISRGGEVNSNLNDIKFGFIDNKSPRP